MRLGSNRRLSLKSAEKLPVISHLFKGGWESAFTLDFSSEGGCGGSEIAPHIKSD